MAETSETNLILLLGSKMCNCKCHNNYYRSPCGECRNQHPAAAGRVGHVGPIENPWKNSSPRCKCGRATYLWTFGEDKWYCTACHKIIK